MVKNMCVLDLVIFLAKGTSGDELTLPDLRGGEKMMILTVIICIFIRLYCCDHLNFDCIQTYSLF